MPSERNSTCAAELAGRTLPSIDGATTMRAVPSTRAAPVTHAPHGCATGDGDEQAVSPSAVSHDASSVPDAS